MNLLKSLGGASGRRRDHPTGPLSGRTLPLPGGFTVKVDAVLGEGGFATIYRAVDVTDPSRAFALKHCNLSGDADAERDVTTEAAVMKALAWCPDVLTLRSSALGKGEAFLLLDLCYGTLASCIIERGASLSNDDVVAAFSPVARAVAALHALDPPMAHFDVKAENTLLTGDRRWVLCDFGSATRDLKVHASPAEIARLEERVRKHTTPAYRAPELWDLYDRQFIGTPVDVWALGCLLYFIAYGVLPFGGGGEGGGGGLSVLNGEVKVPPGRPEGVEDLILACLKTRPGDRISAAEVVERAATMMHSSGRRREGERGGAVKKNSSIVANGAGAAAAAAAGAATTTNLAGDAWGAEFDVVSASKTPAASDNSGWANFGSPAPAPAATATAAPAAAMERLSVVDSSASQWEEHCKVLEQVLEERGREVEALRRHVAAKDAEIEALKAEIATMRRSGSSNGVHTSARGEGGERGGAARPAVVATSAPRRGDVFGDLNPL